MGTGTIEKTYTAYEDHYLGDGNRGGSTANDVSQYTLFGGTAGLQCLMAGVCTGKVQDAPLQLLGTDSYGCCCSPGAVGLGLNIDEYSYGSAQSVLRYMECDSTLVRNSVQQGPCTGIEACQFEITSMPRRGTLYTLSPTGGRGFVLGNCSKESPCIVQPTFNAFQPVNYNLVGSPGRFETSKIFFVPFPGDVGECDASNFACSGLEANSYYLQSNQELWKYSTFEFRVRTFTWKYMTDDTVLKEFNRVGQNRYVEIIEDAYKKYLYMNISDLFFVGGCPCSYRKGPNSNTLGFYCSAAQIKSSCAGGTDTIANAGGSGILGGTTGRIMIIDFARMRAVDGGLNILCSPIQPSKCYTSALISSMLAEVKLGCGISSGNISNKYCFTDLACQNECTGQAYQIARVQTGLSDPANQTTRIVPYNDRPTVGGAGNSLRFDGLDDLIAGTVDVFPQNAFTIMFWMRGLDPSRRAQALLQVISPDKGIELQVFNSANLELVVHGHSSGPTGIDVNSDLQWHHIAITWTGTQGYLSDNSFLPPGSARIYVDCNMTLDLAKPRSSQSTAFGGAASYECAKGQASWSGVLAPGEKFSNNVEVSFGQRQACNATTKAKQEEINRRLLLSQNSTFCRRSLRQQCDPAFNHTVSAFIPGIFSPQRDCTETTSGIFLSGENCTFNSSDPYSNIFLDTVHLQMAIDWMESNDVNPATGMQGSIYTIPVVKGAQVHQKRQCNCVSGCFDSDFAFVGHLDDFRIYNYTFSSREIAFVNGEGVRDGVNCDTSTVFIKAGPSEARCSHMIDTIYKFGIVLYWPFDDPVDLYGVGSTLTRGSSNLEPDFSTSYDVAQVANTAIGNSVSGIKYAARLGGGLDSASPMLVPSTAPVRGAKSDFIQYARGTYQEVRLSIRDVDTCTNAADPLDSTSDSFEPGYCDAIACPDSLCDLLRVVMTNTGYGMGIIYQSKVRDACKHPYSETLCAPFPECEGLKCFDHSGSPQQTNQLVNRQLGYTGAWVYEGSDQTRFDAGREGVTYCDSNSCSRTTFSMSQKASNIPSGRTGSYTYQSVKLQQGSITEYRNIICHGGGKCDASIQSPDPGWVLTLDRPLSFVPLSGRTNYWVYKGKYEPIWLVFYFSASLGGGSIGTDLIKYDVYDAPGEAGTQLNSNINSPQYIYTATIPLTAGWNQPILEGQIIITPINAPLAFPYNVTLQKGLSPALIGADVVLDADSSQLGFNLTVNGPQQADLADMGIKSTAGNKSGAIFQVIEMHCGLIPKTANCFRIPSEQIIAPHSANQGVTWCDDEFYIKSYSIMQTLMNLHRYFRFGLISKLCTRNYNKTEIYNITAYNFSCFPPCVGTLYTFEEKAIGCIRNCTLVSQEPELVCENTYGLYPNEYVCVGGEYHGQPCMGLDDQGSCFDAANPTQTGVCADRDQVPGISGPNLKSLPGFNRSDPGIMVHGVYFGDVQFVDWLHRGARVVWNEVSVDVAAGLGFVEILKYLIQNGCPWRDSAIEAALMRGRPEIAQFLTGLKPPMGVPDGTCGCARFFLHPVDPGIARCFPYTNLECYQSCSRDSDLDVSCIEGLSNYLGPNDTVASSLSQTGNLNAIFLDFAPAPFSSRCSTGSQTALVRGPQAFFLDSNTTYNLREWAGTSVGFSSRVEICTQIIAGKPPIQICGNTTLVQYGAKIDFWNYHVSDPRLRVLYFPPPSAVPGRLSRFNFTVSRMSQFPMQDHTGLNSKKKLLYSTPIAARTAIVDVFVGSINYRPHLDPNFTTYLLKEDQITILTFRFRDIDTTSRDIRAYITRFPLHGDLHQVASSTKILNGSFQSNLSYGFGEQLNCKTEKTDCRATGNCEQPLRNCYYIAETFVIGDLISRKEDMLQQMPIAIFNDSSSSISSLPDERDDGVCWITDRFAEDNWWAGEMFCELAYLDNIPGTCRRCTVPSGIQTQIAPGHWSGRIILSPTYLQRQDPSKIINAPNDPEQEGVCTLEEQCQVMGNVASKGTCIDWPTLNKSGRPTVNQHNIWAQLNPSAPGYPCDGETDKSNCSRNIPYLWPPGYAPYSPNPLPFLTAFGDPVDTNSFYTKCGRRGVHQFRAQYSEQVFMQGFDLHSSMPDSIFFRVLARTARRQYMTHFDLRPTVNTTKETTVSGSATITTTKFSNTFRKERNQTTIFCGGQEWREVWRGYASEGRNASSWTIEVLQGRPDQDNRLSFRFAPRNFTTAELILEACGLMYEGPTNNDGGNPLESLEGLVLVGTKDVAQGLVTDEQFRVAYIPHPHFAGLDSFDVRGEDYQNACHGIECDLRLDLQAGTASLQVESVNDQPIAESVEITGNPDEAIIFTLDGIDGSPDTTSGWTEWGSLGQGAGAGSRFGPGPALSHDYSPGDADPFGSPDKEPDSALSASITKNPDVGTLVLLGGRTYKYTPASGGGGRPYTQIFYKLTDPHGLDSSESVVTINILCNAGFFIDQTNRLCQPCQPGFYKPVKDDSESCMICDRGYYSSNMSATVCHACSIGTFASTPAAARCNACRPGTFGNTTALQLCPACPSGTFSPRPFATECTDCGPLSYNPLPGLPRCYDCPYMSRSGSLSSNNVANCICIHDAYRQSIFSSSVLQPWSSTGHGTSNGSVVAPGIAAIDKPWPMRLHQISSNCTPCPIGGFCYGRDISPVSKISYWTDWSAEKVFWPNPIKPQFYLCNSRNVRAVCMGYPMFASQEQEEICRYRKNYGTCNAWPKFAYEAYRDPARCKAGYEGVICSQCISYELQQCVPLNSDVEDGWLSWMEFAKYRSQMAFNGVEVPDCYSFGGCNSTTDASECASKQNSCNAHSEICRWDTKTYYRNYAGFCLPCPLALGPGFIIYVAWFAVYGTAVAILVLLYLTDMKSFSITINFLQSAALIARFQLPWPSLALSLLSACSLANVNLEALPWKCFFNVSPSYTDFWILTVFVPAGLMAGTIVWWIFPFLVVPPRGKIALKAFKQIMAKRDDRMASGSFARSQYITPRSQSQGPYSPRDQAEASKIPASSMTPIEPDTGDWREAPKLPAQSSSRRKLSEIRQDSAMAWDDGNNLPKTSFDSPSYRRPASRKMDDISLEDVGVESAVVSGSRFGSPTQYLPRRENKSPARNWPRATATLDRIDEVVGKRTTSRRLGMVGSAEKECTTSSPVRCDPIRCNPSDQNADLSLPGAVSSGDFVEDAYQIVSGASFGTLFASKGSTPLDPVRTSNKRGFFNRGKAAVTTVENSASSHVSALDQSDESQRLIGARQRSPDILTVDEGFEGSEHPNVPKLFGEENEGSGEFLRQKDSTTHSDDSAGLLTPSRKRRIEEGYREWSTKNITQSFNPKMEERQDTARSTASSDEVYKPIGLPWYARRQYLDLAWRNCVGILDMMFIMTSCKTLEVFQWRYWTDSTAVLDADPGMLAFSTAHKGLISFAVIVFPIYVGSPVINNFFIFVGFWRKKMDDQTFAMRWGFLLDPFERRFWFWNIVISFRKFCFVIAVVFLGSYQYLQTFLPIVVLAANLIANYQLRPYREERHNFLENMLLIGLFVMIVAGMMAPGDIALYHDTHGRDFSGPYDAGMTFCIMVVLGLALIISGLCMYADVMDAQVSMPTLIRYAYSLILIPVLILRVVLMQLYRALRFLLLPPKHHGQAQQSTSQAPKFQNATAFNRSSHGDPPVLTGTRLIDVFWEGVKKMRSVENQPMLQNFDDNGILIRPDDGSSWLRDKFAMQKRIFTLERKLKVESTFDPRSAMILRTERELSVALDAVIDYEKREYRELFDQLYDAQTENQLLNVDWTNAKAKVSMQEEILKKITEASNFSRVKLDTEIRRIGQPEEWRRRFLSEQATRHALEQEIVDLQAQVDQIRLQEAGVWHQAVSQEPS